MSNNIYQKIAMSMSKMITAGMRKDPKAVNQLRFGHIKKYDVSYMCEQHILIVFPDETEFTKDTMMDIDIYAKVEMRKENPEGKPLNIENMLAWIDKDTKPIEHRIPTWADCLPWYDMKNPPQVCLNSKSQENREDKCLEIVNYQRSDDEIVINLGFFKHFAGMHFNFYLPVMNYEDNQGRTIKKYSGPILGIQIGTDFVPCEDKQENMRRLCDTRQIWFLVMPIYP